LKFFTNSRYFIKCQLRMALWMIVFIRGTPTFDLNKEQRFAHFKILVMNIENNSIESRSIERMGKDSLFVH